MKHMLDKKIRQKEKIYSIYIFGIIMLIALFSFYNYFNNLKLILYIGFNIFIIIDLAILWKTNRKTSWNNKYIVFLLHMLLFATIICMHYGKYSYIQILQGNIWNIILILELLFIIYMEDFKKVRPYYLKHSKWINRGVLFVSPIISFITFEIMSNTFSVSMFLKYGIFNFIWYALMYLLVFILIGNIKYAIIISNFLIYIVALVNYCVFIFRGSPITPSDIKSWNTALNVVNNYSFVLSKKAVIASLIMLGWYILTDKLENYKYLKIKDRIKSIIGYFSILITVIFLFFYTNLIDAIDVRLNFWTPSETYRTYGSVLGFSANVKSLIIKEPEGYSEKGVKQLLDLKEVNQELEVKPNIIVIMNEAYSDLSIINNLSTNIEYMPFTKRLKENTVKGNLYVSVYGGMTSNTEYEFLTGNSMANMPSGSVPYQQFINDNTDSLASNLKEQGYYNIAIHPFYSTGYNRDRIYPYLGFDEFLSISEFNNPEMIRNYISDNESFNKIIERYESKEDGIPLFIFNVTMQNHGGYTSDELMLDTSIKLNSLKEYPQTEQYLSLIHESEKSFEKLVKYFSNEDEPTIILMFGDHQPVIENEFYEELYGKGLDELSLEEYQKKHIVPFVIWTNYDIEESYIDKMSINYLSSFLLKTANLRMTKYNQYLLNLFDKVPVINQFGIIGNDDINYYLSQESDFLELVKEYQYIQYNNVFDRKNRADSVFSLSE